MSPRRAYPTLADWRNEQGWSQERAAQYLGVDQAYYSRIERRLRSPRPQRAKAISKATGVPLESILGIAS